MPCCSLGEGCSNKLVVRSALSSSKSSLEPQQARCLLPAAPKPHLKPAHGALQGASRMLQWLDGMLLLMSSCLPQSEISLNPTLPGPCRESAELWQ